MDKFGGIKENVEVVRSFDWWTVVIGVLIAIGIVMLCVKLKTSLFLHLELLQNLL